MIGIFELGLFLALAAVLAVLATVIVVGVVLAERRTRRPSPKPAETVQDPVLR